jgi:hypothetical protein
MVTMCPRSHAKTREVERHMHDDPIEGSCKLKISILSNVAAII